MCGTARDLQRCMTNLMWFTEENILVILPLEPADDLPLAFSATEEEATLLGKPQEVHVTATHPPRHEEWAPEPWSTPGLGEAATEPQGM